MRTTAYSVKIEGDEDGYHLILETEDADLDINIQDIVFDFYAAVQADIRPYVLEAEDARATMPQLITNRPVSVEDAIDAGYALDDPKSPGYHDRMVD